MDATEKLRIVRAQLVDAIEVIDGEGDPPPPPPPTGDTPHDQTVYSSPIVEKPGLFLRCGQSNPHWGLRWNLRGRLAAFSLSCSVKVSDHVDPDPEDTLYPVLWAQPTDDWRTMLAYVLQSSSSKKTRINSKVYLPQAINIGPRFPVGQKVRVDLELNGHGGQFVATLPSGAVLARTTLPAPTAALPAVRDPFVEFGTMPTPTGEGPEADTYGWEFFDLRVTWGLA